MYVHCKHVNYDIDMTNIGIDVAIREKVNFGEGVRVPPVRVHSLKVQKRLFHLDASYAVHVSLDTNILSCIGNL